MDQMIESYITDSREKIALKELVDCFKGKAISSKIEEGEFALINLSDMGKDGIDYDHLRRFQLERRQLLRYILEDGDVLIASKGTVKKVCVFHKQAKEVVASSNITILRPKANCKGYYLKFFLDSPLGQAFLERADHGKDVINLSTKELLEIPIPIIPLLKQDYLIKHYLQGLNDYHRKVNRAEQEWARIQKEIEKSVL
ncbi:restriction endonuclease subunit S [Streptococcus iniae]|uniref:Restriction endonuclease subunit S n=1 Tax=Streptococcus iniae TaxID=1346 RepID=A0A3L8GL78_STRIN|nr:restriction endonuclease subunit S [Streptococcus iniae]AGM98742.1 hypothetical protein K710_0968 [Streptococcus iniae SF1]AHY15707.1 restriction endonuclease subunit S [Streptococcus iniae]AHY17575.1 restriction endonuclease subunit S [Streptococcus iniae]AJG25873.1 restriction endonuclease subunit S [Streptococcus iniae]APD31746.1 restriction endonuclease subunit S [Streptococcus iniae]